MSKTQHNKLVRDRIPEIIERNGESAKTRELSLEEYKEELLKKIVEEAGEVQEAHGNADDIKKELADVLEVVEHIIKAYKLDPNEVADVKRHRAHERGGFSQRIYLESTESDKK